MTGVRERKIMIVEDNTVLRQSILDLLSEHGFHNLVAFGDGLNAVSYCRETRPDLAVLDVDMAGLSGLDILCEIRSMSQKLPVVMMSASHDRHILIQACESGANTFFPKPFDSDMFCRKIEALLENVSFLK